MVFSLIFRRNCGFFFDFSSEWWIFRGFFVDGGSGDPTTGCRDGARMVQGWCEDGARMVQSGSVGWGDPLERHIREKNWLNKSNNQKQRPVYTRSDNALGQRHGEFTVEFLVLYSREKKNARILSMFCNVSLTFAICLYVFLGFC